MSSEGFKETEIGLIPEEWEFINIKNSPVEIIDGDRSSNYPKRDELLNEGDLPFLSTKNIKNHRFNFNDAVFVTEEKFDSINKGKVNENDIVMTTRGSVGNVALFKNLPFKSALINAQMLIFRSNSKYLSSQYLYYLLTSNFLQKQFTTFSSGSAQPQLPISHLKSINLIIPSLTEQNLIAKILTDLDKKIELNHDMNRTLESIGQAIFRHWFVHFEFPDSDGRPYKSSGGDMVDSELGEIPQGWEIKPLDKIANYLNGLALQKYPPEDDDYLPVIKIRELKQGITQQTDKASRQIPEEYVIDDGDIIFSWSGSLEVVIWGEGKGALNQHLFKVSSDEFPKWFYYYQTLRFLPSFRQTAADKATTMGHIKRQHLTESLVPVPNNEILSKASMVLKPIINQIINNKTQSRYLKALRDSLLPKLMSGKIRVNVPEEATVK